MTTARAAPALAAFLSTLLLMPWIAWAYRPFISTDAAVADQRDLEIELGYFALEQAKGENTFRVPSLVLNYGAWKNTEIVGEFRIERNPRGDIDVVDPGLFLKAVLKEGLLQEKPGVSFADRGHGLIRSWAHNGGAGEADVHWRSEMARLGAVFVSLGGTVMTTFVVERRPSTRNAPAVRWSPCFMLDRSVRSWTKALT